MTLLLKRLSVLVVAVGALEFMCRIGWIPRMTMLPPSEATAHLAFLLLTGRASADIAYTLINVTASVMLSIVAGFLAGVVIHRFSRLRSVLEPLLASYYAVPIFIFYPLLIVLFGLNRVPLIAIGVMFGIVAMIVSTMNGLDHLPRALAKSARLFRLTPAQELFLVSVPAAAPSFITGIKLAIIYSVIANIAGEFLLSARGIGFRIAFAYNSFDGRTMYALMILVLVSVTTIVLLLHSWEKAVHRRWGRE